MPLVINGFGGGHTDTHTQTHRHKRILTRGLKQFQEIRRAWPSAARAWFKKCCSVKLNLGPPVYTHMLIACGMLVGCLTYRRQITIWHQSYVNNKLLHGTSVKAFYYQLHSLLSIIISMSTIVISIYVMLEDLSNITTQTCCPLMRPQKTKQTRW